MPRRFGRRTEADAGPARRAVPRAEVLSVRKGRQRKSPWIFPDPFSLAAHGPDLVECPARATTPEYCRLVSSIAVSTTSGRRNRRCLNTRRPPDRLGIVGGGPRPSGDSGWGLPSPVSQSVLGSDWRRDAAANPPVWLVARRRSRLTLIASRISARQPASRREPGRIPPN